MNISIRIWSAQYPNADQNIQRLQKNDYIDRFLDDQA